METEVKRLHDKTKADCTIRNALQKARKWQLIFGMIAAGKEAWMLDQVREARQSFWVEEESQKFPHLVGDQRGCRYGRINSSVQKRDGPVASGFRKRIYNSTML